MNLQKVCAGELGCSSLAAHPANTGRLNTERKMSEDKTEIKNSPQAKAVTGIGGIQRGEKEARQRIKRAIEKDCQSIREGHTSGGYCDTEQLLASEKRLAAIIQTEIEEAIEARDRNLQFALERQLRGFAWKPRLVVAQD